MTFLFRVRLASFAGATTVSLAGFYLLYKDYMLAKDVATQKMEGIYETLDERYEALDERYKALDERFEALNRRFMTLENQRET